jgi:hypothetical protein
MRKVLIGAAFAAGVGLSGQANASTNLLVNGSFETGDVTGWTIFGDFSFSGVSGAFDGVAPEDGNYQVFLGSVSTTGGIYQTFTDTPGVEYTATGWYTGIGGPPSSLEISLDSTDIINLNPAPSDGVYTEFVYQFIGTGSDTVTITSYQLPSYNLVDNFTVTTSTVPEPSTWAMMLLGFSGLGFMGWRSSRRAAAHAA